MASESNQKRKKRRKKHILLIIILLLLLLLIGFLYFLFTRKEIQPVEGQGVELDTVEVPVPIIRDTIKKVIKKVPVFPKDTIEVKPDTVDTVQKDTVVYDPCQEDTIAPWVYPDPSGGLHYGKIYVRFVASEPCRIEWRFKKEPDWKVYKDDSIAITKKSILCFRAQDTCGNSMGIRYEKYEISVPIKRYCPEDMEYIKISTTKFCIDRYEWPNKKGKKPLAYISIYHAMDSCFTSGKRLCTTEEWSLACGGVYKWKYPYGDRYEPKACVTRDTAANPSGSFLECRGYFGVFDMSGNLAEWTSTRSKKNKDFYNVMGGFWESGPQSRCFNPRYSYFPQNRHNPVGFRCCKGVNK